MILRGVLLLLLCINSFFVAAQDERLIRKYFTNKNLIISEKQKLDKDYFFQVNSPIYRIDLNSDQKKEMIIWDIKDGRNWINIYNIYKKRIKRFELTTKGHGSKVYRISIRKISAKTKILFVYFYEGKTKYLDFTGSSRVYFISIDNNNLNTLSIYKGPAIWGEGEYRNTHYHQRKYRLSLFDFNNDGVLEVLIKDHKNSRVYFYEKYQTWIEI